MKLQAHRLANHFPMMGASELAALSADIARNGLRQAVVVYDGKILDGRNRYRACQKAGVKPRFETYKGKDPLAFVVSQNIVHRHLTD
ncbi:MAG: ParB N-terminal domain-containing protein, partial [Candidatus Cybelea sp.]